MKSEQTYTISETARLLKIEQGRLREWVAKGYIVPGCPSKGRGRSHLFKKNDLYLTRLFQRLIEAGFTRNEAVIHAGNFNFNHVSKTGRNLYCFKESWSRIGQFGETPTVDGFFLVNDDPSVITMTDVDIFVIVMNLGAIKKEIDDLIG